jgi:hypothetical protein
MPRDSIGVDAQPVGGNLSFLSKSLLIAHGLVPVNDLGALRADAKHGDRHAHIPLHCRQIVLDRLREVSTAFDLA